MAINFDCENCGKQMQVQDHLAGKTGKCPECGQSVTVPEGGGIGEFDFSGLEDPHRKPCPMCGELIERTASTCRHCGEQLDAPAGRQQKKRKPAAESQKVKQANTTALQLFITGLLGCFSPILAIYGIVFLLRNQFDYSRKTLAIVGTVLRCVWAVFLIITIASGNL